MTNDVLIGRVRELIRILQITQNEFADRIKTDRSNFSKHVNGKMPINDSLVNKIVVGWESRKSGCSAEQETYSIRHLRNTARLFRCRRRPYVPTCEKVLRCTMSM